MSRTSKVELRVARAEEAAEISRLALRSKGHWGYAEQFLEACRDELTYTPEQCTSGAMVVAAGAERSLGFYLLDGSPPDGELAALFVDTDVIGCGLGGRLLRHALARAAGRGFRTLSLDADPGAEPFHLRHGAVRIGQAPSGSIPGRLLPRLRFDLG